MQTSASRKPHPGLPVTYLQLVQLHRLGRHLAVLTPDPARPRQEPRPSSQSPSLLLHPTPTALPISQGRRRSHASRPLRTAPREGGPGGGRGLRGLTRWKRRPTAGPHRRADQWRGRRRLRPTNRRARTGEGRPLPGDPGVEPWPRPRRTGFRSWQVGAARLEKASERHWWGNREGRRRCESP